MEYPRERDNGADTERENGALYARGRGGGGREEDRTKRGGKRYETCAGQGDRFKLVEMHRAFRQKSTLFTKRNTYGGHRKLAIVK